MANYTITTAGREMYALCTQGGVFRHMLTDHLAIRLCGESLDKMTKAHFIEYTNGDHIIMFTFNSAIFFSRRFVGFKHHRNAKPCFIYVNSYKDTENSMECVVFVIYPNEIRQLSFTKQGDELILCNCGYCYSWEFLKKILPEISVYPSFEGLTSEKIKELMSEIALKI